MRDMTHKTVPVEPTAETKTLFVRMEDGYYAEQEATERIEEILGCELNALSFDWHDTSFEIYPAGDVEDVAPTEEQHAAILALGCARYWINFKDGSERYCRGERKQAASGLNRWDSNNRFADKRREKAAPPSPVTELEAMLYEALRAFRDGGPEGGTDFNGWHQSYEEPCRLARAALAAFNAKKEVK